MIVSGVLSLVGLMGIPLGDMQVRNIGIIGYAVVTLFVFPLLGIIFGRAQSGAREATPRAEVQSGSYVA